MFWLFHLSILHICYGLNCVTPKDVEVLTPSTSECDLMWKQLLQIWLDKVRSLGYAPDPYNFILTERGNLGAETHTNAVRMAGGREGGDLDSTSTSQRTPRFPEAGMISPRGCRRSHSPMLSPWFQTSNLQNFVTINFCCLNHPVCDPLLLQTWESYTVLLVFLIFSTLICAVASHCGFNLHFSGDGWQWAVFHVSIDHL